MEHEHGISAGKPAVLPPGQGHQGFKNCSPELPHCQRASPGGAELCQCLPARHQGVPSSKGKGQGSACQEMWEEVNAV